jgi:hypothetical protein
MRADSCGRFIYSGVKQAGGLFLVLLLLVVIAWLAGVTIVAIWIVGLLIGPIVPVLVSFDITNTQFQALGLSLVFPYWACLGASVGFLRWRANAGAASGEQTSLTKPILKQIRWSVAMVAFVVGLISTLMWPSFVSGGPSRTSAIINNLRQLDGAKQQLALEKKLSPDYVPNEADLAPYLGRPEKPGITPIGTERYVLNRLSETPYAVLDSDWRIRRRGWREGYTIPKGKEYRLPSSQK